MDNNFRNNSNNYRDIDSDYFLDKFAQNMYNKNIGERLKDVGELDPLIGQTVAFFLLIHTDVGILDCKPTVPPQIRIVQWGFLWAMPTPSVCHYGQEFSECELNL